MLNNINIVVECKAGHLPTDTVTAIRNIFNVDNFEVATSNQPLELQLADVLFGSRQTRMGNAPTPQQRTYMAEVISAFTNSGSPIELLSMYGALKAYGLDESRLDIDLMDLMALRRLHWVNQRVRKLYKPGIVATIMAEDATEHVLSGATVSPSLQAKMDTYLNGVQSLIDVTGLRSVVTIHREKDLISRKGVACNTYLDAVRSNAAALLSYWQVSRATDYVDTENTQAYQHLYSIGWRGVIPGEMWQHYLDRALTEQPNASVEVRAKHITTYMGNSLARRQFGLLNGRHGMKPVKFAFNQMPPGSNPDLMLGRVEYKLKDSKNSHANIPPWAGFGGLERRQGKLEYTGLGVNEHSKLNSSIDKAAITLTAWVPVDAVAAAEMSVCVRCELIPSKPAVVAFQPSTISPVFEQAAHAFVD